MESKFHYNQSKRLTVTAKNDSQHGNHFETGGKLNNPYVAPPTGRTEYDDSNFHDNRQRRVAVM